MKYKDFINDRNFNPSAEWNVIETLYNSNIYNTVPKIPKIIHQIWLGGELPSKYKELCTTFKELNPDWEYKLWTDEEVEKLNNDQPLINIHLYNNVQNLGSKADILRYELLHRFGGLYFDTDFICVKPLDSLLNYDFISASCDDPNVNILNGMMGSIKNNPFMVKLIVELFMLNAVSSFYGGIMEQTGPGFLLKQFLNNLDINKNSIILPPAYVYPFPGNERHTIRNNNIHELSDIMKPYINEHTLAVHLWYTSWQN